MNAPGDRREGKGAREGGGEGSRKVSLALKSIVRSKGTNSESFPKVSSRHEEILEVGITCTPERRLRKLVRESGVETPKENCTLSDQKFRGCQSEADSPFKAAAEPRVIQWHNSLITVSNFPSFPNLTRRPGPRVLAARPRVLRELFCSLAQENYRRNSSD